MVWKGSSRINICKELEESGFWKKKKLLAMLQQHWPPICSSNRPSSLPPRHSSSLFFLPKILLCPLLTQPGLAPSSSINYHHVQRSSHTNWSKVSSQLVSQTMFCSEHLPYVYSQYLIKLMMPAINRHTSMLHITRKKGVLIKLWLI